MNPLYVYFAITIMVLTSREIEGPLTMWSREMWIVLGANGLAFLLLVLARELRVKRGDA